MNILSRKLEETEDMRRGRSRRTKILKRVVVYFEADELLDKNDDQPSETIHDDDRLLHDSAMWIAFQELFQLLFQLDRKSELDLILKEHDVEWRMKPDENGEMEIEFSDSIMSAKKMERIVALLRDLRTSTSHISSQEERPTLPSSAPGESSSSVSTTSTSTSTSSASECTSDTAQNGENKF